MHVLQMFNEVCYIGGMIIRAERDILTKVDFPFVVGLNFSFQTEEKLFLVMRFLSGGELFFHLRKQGLILEDTARFYIAEMVLAIEHLHSRGIIHRDLKVRRCLALSEARHRWLLLTSGGCGLFDGCRCSLRTFC